MTKTEFLEQLKNSLTGLSEEDIKKSVDYYEEMIDDRMEDGFDYHKQGGKTIAF